MRVGLPPGRGTKARPDFAEVISVSCPPLRARIAAQRAVIWLRVRRVLQLRRLLTNRHRSGKKPCTRILLGSKTWPEHQDRGLQACPRGVTALATARWDVAWSGQAGHRVLQMRPFAVPLRLPRQAQCPAIAMLPPPNAPKPVAPIAQYPPLADARQRWRHLRCSGC